MLIKSSLGANSKGPKVGQGQSELAVDRPTDRPASILAFSQCSLALSSSRILAAFSRAVVISHSRRVLSHSRVLVVFSRTVVLSHSRSVLSQYSLAFSHSRPLAVFSRISLPLGGIA
jgi:hypothetical protein